MDFASLDAPDFDLAETLDSGQVFHWLPQSGGGFCGCIGRDPVWVRQDADCLQVYPAAMAETVRHYFRLDADHAGMLATLPSDPMMDQAVKFCPGLRILRQPLWECLATFITSSLKQVEHIRQISLTLRAAYGAKHELKPPGEKRVTLYAYPTPESLAQAGEAALRECRLGYRAKSLHLAAAQLQKKPDFLDSARSATDTEVLKHLCSLHGVGEKIANCVLLFAYDRLCAFPIDVWIERVLRQSYDAWSDEKKVTKTDLAAFASEYFGENGGYAQQYLFHFARRNGRKAIDSSPKKSIV